MNREKIGMVFTIIQQHFIAKKRSSRRRGFWHTIMRPPWDEGEEPWLEAYDRNSDLDRYIDWILNHTEEDFENQYGDYAIVMKKYDIVKQLLIDGGFLK